MSTVLGYRPTEQAHRDSRRELERGARELREDAATFELTEPSASGTPIPYLVNPQSDTTPPTYACQTIKHAIDFARDSDFWRDDTALLPRQRQTAAQRMKHEFRYADGRQTAATSESASTTTFVAEDITPETIEHIRQAALASGKKTSAATGEDKTEEEKKKEGEGEMHMEQDDALVDGQNKDATGDQIWVEAPALWHN